MLPLSVFWMPQWHPREMLFGFALAVVAGNQLGVVRGARLWGLFALWLGARLAGLLAPEEKLFIAANALFAAALALAVAPRQLRAAKKWRNRALPFVIVALCVAAAMLEVRIAVLLFATLMLFMGGRILAPAVAGQLERQGIALEARVQPRVEGALLVTMGGSFLFTPFCMIAGLLAAIRLARWRLWQVRGRPDLLCLAAGYAWLAAGLVAFGLHPGTAAVHVITVGALGTITFNVMALSSRSLLKVAGTALLAAATASRVLDLLAPAALWWSAAFLVLLALFLKEGLPPGKRRR